MAPLLRESLAQGHPFGQTLVNEYVGGVSRFARPGEAANGAYAGARLANPDRSLTTDLSTRDQRRLNESIWRGIHAQMYLVGVGGLNRDPCLTLLQKAVSHGWVRI